MEFGILLRVFAYAGRLILVGFGLNAEQSLESMKGLGKERRHTEDLW